METYKRKIYMGMIMITLGIVFNTTMKENMASIGTIFIAIGGLFFISGMAEKRKIN